jgi:hypothetical protein
MLGVLLLDHRDQPKPNGNRVLSFEQQCRATLGADEVDERLGVSAFRPDFLLGDDLESGGFQMAPDVADLMPRHCLRPDDS